MVIKKFKTKWLKKYFEIMTQYGDTNVVSNEIIAVNEWDYTHEIIFKYKDKYYSCERTLDGAESYDSWDEEESIKCIEVTPVEKMVIVYERV